MALGGPLCDLPPAALPMYMLVSALAVVSMRATFVLSQHRLQDAAVQHAGPAGWQAHTGVNKCGQCGHPTKFSLLALIPTAGFVLAVFGYSPLASPCIGAHL